MTEPLDLDAARAARAEGRGDNPQVRFAGRLWDLPAELPAEYGWALLEGDTKAAVRLLLGDDFDEFWAAGPTRDDLIELVKAIPRYFGLDSLGEPSASPASSTNGGSRSRPTSPAAIGSTSAKPSGARRRSG